MKIEDVKKELMAYKNNCKLIMSIEEEIEFYNSKLTSCTSQISQTPKGGSEVQDKIAEYIVKLEELKASKYSQLIELENKKAQVENAVHKLEQPFRNLLYLTYIQSCEYEDQNGHTKTVIGHTLFETSYIMNYTYKYTCKLHGKALLEYLKVREHYDKHETNHS